MTTYTDTRQLPFSWTKLAQQYGTKVFHVQSTTLQPINYYDVQIIYKDIPGQIRFEWNGDMPSILLEEEDNLITGTGGYSKFSLEIPAESSFLKVMEGGAIFSLFASLGGKKVRTGDQEFDKRFITQASPKTLVQHVGRQLEFLLNPLFGNSLVLESKIQDAITCKFYLELKINTLVTNEILLNSILEELVSLRKIISAG